LASGSGQRGDCSRLTGTRDETGDFAVRLSPDFRTGASEMCIKVAAVLQKDFVPCSHEWLDWLAHLELVRKKPTAEGT
jgi:hypothetical protein